MKIPASVERGGVDYAAYTRELLFSGDLWKMFCETNIKVTPRARTACLYIASANTVLLTSGGRWKMH